MNALLSDQRTLSEYSRAWGKDLLLAQAAGGNVSVKYAPHHVAVKGSGIRLRELTAQRGWACADWRYVRTGLARIFALSSLERREWTYAALLGKASAPCACRASMETGFHAILAERYVVHLHSVAGIIIGMMPDSQALALLGEAGSDFFRVSFVPRAIPGFELTRFISKGSVSLHDERPHLRILRNHGVIWTASSAQKLARLAHYFERVSRRLLNLERYPPPHSAGSAVCKDSAGRARPVAGATVREICFCHWPEADLSLVPLFPDFVIYFDLWSARPPDVVRTASRRVRISAKTPAQWQDKRDVFYAHALVTTVAKRLGPCPALPASMIRALKSMETERLRLKEILKS